MNQSLCFKVVEFYWSILRCWDKVLTIWSHQTCIDRTYNVRWGPEELLPLWAPSKEWVMVLVSKSMIFMQVSWDPVMMERQSGLTAIVKIASSWRLSKEKARRFSTRSKILRLLSAEPERRYLTSGVIARAVTASGRRMLLFYWNKKNQNLYG